MECGFKLADVENSTIVNKPVLVDEILEVIENPSEQGKGKQFEYRFREGWGIL